jgi:hypothetical protein
LRWKKDYTDNIQAYTKVISIQCGLGIKMLDYSLHKKISFASQLVVSEKYRKSGNFLFSSKCAFAKGWLPLRQIFTVLKSILGQFVSTPCYDVQFQSFAMMCSFNHLI